MRRIATDRMGLNSMAGKIRTFIAIDLPDHVLHGIGSVQTGLKRTDLKIKWVRLASMHLTLKFLGDIPSDRIEVIGTALKETVKGIGPFVLEGKAVGVFPDLRRPRVVWAGVCGELEALHGLYERLEQALEDIGFPKEKRRVRAHLTIGRIKGRVKKQVLRAAVEGGKDFLTDPFDVASVILYQSTLRPQGAVYTKLVEAELMG